MDKPLTYLRKLPGQRRSSATFDAIVEAAAHILRDGGPRALTTNKVAARAGVSIGSLYQYFPNKQAVVRALLERQVKHAEAMRPKVLDDERATASIAMRAAIDWHFDLHQIDARYAQNLHRLAATVLPIEEQRRIAALRHDRVNRTVARFMTDASTERTGRMAFIVDAAITAIAREAMRRHPDWLADDAFRAQVASVLVAALGARSD